MSQESQTLWYCLKAKPKREHFAASILRSRTSLELFCPRVTFTRKTIRGLKSFTEALFPGYFFCRFDFESQSRLVLHSQDVVGVVKFGEHIPVIPAHTISELQKVLPSESAELKPPRIEEGELVEIIRGCFLGECGTVLKVDPATDRVH
ncbi:MAG: hypothetical protein KJT03_07865, partial [Verrucomicrobiae bacterium]|nr:hypothetical protein [Verrucomicrobiae bacterium]